MGDTWKINSKYIMYGVVLILNCWNGGNGRLS